MSDGYKLIKAELGAWLQRGEAHLLGEALELSPDTAGLLGEHPGRVHLLPAADAALIGVGVGLALSGSRAVVCLSGPAALWGALQQLGQEAAAFSAAGEWSLPLVLRVPVAPGETVPADLLTDLEGVNVAAASTPQDAAGLLKAALHGSRPTVLLEDRALLGQRSGETASVEGFGQARVARPGAHATALAWGAGVAAALAAAESLAKEGLDVEVLDLVSLSPLDLPAIAASIDKTGRPVLVGAPRAALVAAIEAGFLRLESPPDSAPAEPVALAQTLRGSIAY